MVILQGISVFFHMCVIPFLVGCILVSAKEAEKKCNVAVRTAAGLMVTYALYEILTLAMQLRGKGFREVSQMYLYIVLALAFAGLLFFGYEVVCKIRGKHLKNYLLLEKPDGFMIAALVLIGIQIAAILLMATPDKDDAFYSGLSSMSLSYDYLLEYDAYNGNMVKEISARYKISALPVYQAALSLFSGLHHLVITHNLFPLFYMPLAYALYDKIGKSFLEKEGHGKARGKFMFAFALLHMIGNYYVFSPENFLVTRIWQGKALFAAIGVPFLWICGQTVFLEEKTGIGRQLKGWFLMACALLACTFMGETGLFLGVFMVACQTMAGCLVTKKWWKLIPAVLCCVPEILIVVKFLM